MTGGDGGTGGLGVRQCPNPFRIVLSAKPGSAEAGQGDSLFHPPATAAGISISSPDTFIVLPN